MADLTIAGTIKKKAGAATREVTFGATVTAGDALYEDAADSGHAKPAIKGGTVEQAAVKGIALCDGIDGQQGQMLIDGDLDMGTTTMVVGRAYFVGAAAGGIGAEADNGAGDFSSYVGYCTASDTLTVQLHRSGVAHA